VRVVSDRRGQRPATEFEAANEAAADPAGSEVSLHDGDLEQVAGRIRERLAVFHERLVDQ
jgi:hypothetical protein